VSTYITREGAKALQAELLDLRRNHRPKIVQDVSEAAAQGDRSENAEYIYGKKKLREIDRRILFLMKRLETVTVVDPSDRGDAAADKVFFGATVTVEDEDGKRSTYQIVGPVEIDLTRGRVSHRSPIAMALMKRGVGETVLFRKPSGEVELTILSVEYR
jgi:transcription elongation factor GreB